MSSVREPVQVFQFLEQLYEKFDSLAGRHGVYKVETVGECVSWRLSTMWYCEEAELEMLTILVFVLFLLLSVRGRNWCTETSK